MTYASQQTSQYGGDQITLFEFVSGNRRWTYCDQRASVLRGSDSYLPEVISIGKLEQNLGENAQGVEIMLPASNQLAIEFKPYLPPEPIFVTVWSGHRNDPDAQYLPIFIGECSSTMTDEDGMMTILCVPITYSASRTIPWCVYSGTCNWAVYSTGCGVSRESFRTDGTAQSINVSVLTVPEFASKPDGWFTAGYVVRVSTNEVRWITKHVSDEITLTSPFIGLQSGEALIAYAGCDGLESTCSGKFNNLPRFTGFPDSPERNPFVDNVFGTGSPASGSSNKTSGTFVVTS